VTVRSAILGTAWLLVGFVACRRQTHATVMHASRLHPPGPRYTKRITKTTRGTLHTMYTVDDVEHPHKTLNVLKFATGNRN